jgi:hypothetical protein
VPRGSGSADQRTAARPENETEDLNMCVRQSVVSIIILSLTLHSGACQHANPGAPATQTAEQPKEPLEIVEEFWPDGTPSLRKHVLRQADQTSLNHGLYTRWHANGRKSYEANYIRGELHGVETAWHENGQKRTEQHYDQGLRHGFRHVWDQHGHLVSEEYYVNDRPHGTWTIWKGGKIKWQGRFDHGQPLP